MEGFSGKPFLRIPQISGPRRKIENLFRLMAESPDRAKSYGPRFFPGEVLELFPGDLEGLRKHYQKNVEFIRIEGSKYHIDDRLKSLGLSSNRSVGELGKLIGLLSEPSKSKVAGELLLRYTQKPLATQEEWQAWYRENSDALFFSDRGGYKFYNLPAELKSQSKR